MTEPFDEKRIFIEALSRQGVERDAFLASVCPDSTARRRLEALLRQHESGSSELSPAGDLPEEGEERPDEWPDDWADAEASDFPSDPAAAWLADGEVFGRFRIIQKLGDGGMGVVYLAEDLERGGFVALKLINNELFKDRDAVERFRREARAAARIRHPAVVPVVKFGFHDRRYYIVSEYVAGPTLAQLIAVEAQRRSAGPDDPERRQVWVQRVAEYVATIADALSACQSERVVHRDVKSSNILIDPSFGARLTDFGLAKQLPLGHVDVTSSMLAGTIPYMSPEQVSVELRPVGYRSDIYSLGVVLYECLALERPFRGTPAEVMNAILHDEPMPLRRRDPSLPIPFEIICGAAMEKDIGRRLASPAEMATALRNARDGRPIAIRRPDLRRRAVKWVRRHRRGAAIAGVLALVVLLAGSGLLLREARLARLAIVDVVAPPGAEVLVQRMDEDRLDVESAAVRLGRARIAGATLSPGQYRFTIVAPDGEAFAEIGAVLLAPGRSGRTVIEAELPSAPAGGERRPGTLRGVLRPAHDPEFAGMVPIAAGTFAIGEPDGEAITTRPRSVAIATFLLDPREVSNAEYLAFVQATGHRPPLDWPDGALDPALSARPVTGVTLADAEAYARWRGKRLPTAAEWEAAVRGPGGRRYPWGDALDVDFMSIDTTCEDLRAAATRDHAELRARDALRLVDVATGNPLTDVGLLLQVYGNARELTGTALVGVQRGVVVKGRGWCDPVPHNDLSASWIGPLDVPVASTGFRCARSAAPPAKRGGGG